MENCTLSRDTAVVFAISMCVLLQTTLWLPTPAIVALIAYFGFSIMGFHYQSICIGIVFTAYAISVIRKRKELRNLLSKRAESYNA